MLMYNDGQTFNQTEVCMSVIAVVNPKGGVGKTALATNLASAFSQEGSTKLVDADPSQHSADDWLQWRDDAGHTGIGRAILRGKIYPALNAERDKWDTVVVDCPGSDSDETRGAMGAADLIVMPINIGQSEIKALHQMAKLIKEMRSMGLETAILAVLNNVDVACTRECAEAREMLSATPDLFRLHDTVLWRRQAFRMAFRDGLGVHELPVGTHDGKATAEFRTLFKEVQRELAA
jgi:chromosome partitioning protein